eukprot:351681-Chlamydomonas_euryale.AAC.1
MCSAKRGTNMRAILSQRNAKLAASSSMPRRGATSSRTCTAWPDSHAKRERLLCGLHEAPMRPGRAKPSTLSP